MKITAIRIRKLVSRPTGYGHDAAEIEAKVEEGDDVEEVAQRLHSLVEAEIRRGREIAGLHQTRDDLRREIVSLQDARRGLIDSLERVRKQVAEAGEFADAAAEAGLELPPALSQLTIPF